MPIQRHTDQAYRLTTLTAIGELTPDELMKVVESFKIDPPELNILWDFRKAHPSRSFGVESIKQVAVLVKQTIGSRANGRTAFVAPSDLAFGLSRMYMTHVEIEKSTHKTNVFRTKGEALQWLEAETGEHSLQPLCLMD